MMFRLIQILILWTIVALAASCAPDRAYEGLPEARELQAAPATLTVDGMEIEFTANVSRNLMPRAPGPQEVKGARVTGTLRGVPTGAASPHPIPFPYNRIAIQRLFVVSGDRVWVTKAKARERRQVGSLIMASGEDEGPKWEPGTVVDVFAEVVVPGGNLVYVAARGERVRASS